MHIETVYRMQDQDGTMEVVMDNFRIHIRRSAPLYQSFVRCQPQTRAEAMNLANALGAAHNALLDMAEHLPDDQDPMQDF